MPQNVTWNGITYAIPLAGELNWSSLSNFLIALGNDAAVAQEARQTVRVAVSSPVTVAAATDYAVITDLTVAGAVALTLPAGVAGQIFIIADGKGDAATNNITITPNGAETVGGAATLVLNKNRQSVILGYHVGTTDWKLLDYSIPINGVTPGDLTGIVPASKGGTGAANNDAATMTRTGNFDLQVTMNAAHTLNLNGDIFVADDLTTAGDSINLNATAPTNVTLPTTGTLATLAGTETLTNKTLTAPLQSSYEDFTEIAAPATPAAGTVRVYSKAGGLMYSKDDAGVETAMAAGVSALTEFNVNIGDSTDAAMQADTSILGDISASISQSVVTISNASPGVVSWTAHGQVRGDAVYFTTTGTLPAPLSPSTRYYVTDVNTNDFTVALTPGGLNINTTTAGSGVHTGYAGGFVARPDASKPFIVVDTGDPTNSQGTTDTTTRLFVTVRSPVNQFPEITYAASTANGSTWTINEDGLYYISYSDRINVGSADIGITKNYIGVPSGQDASVVLAFATLQTGVWLNMSTFSRLAAGDVIRAAGDVSANYSTSVNAQFRIYRVF